MYKVYKTISSNVFVTALFIVKIENNLRLFLVKLYIYIYIYICFLGGSDSKESAWNAGDQGSIHGSEKSPGEGNSNPL